jgi:aminoglycoside phosphotransferase family enzyme/predicted kinase
MATRTEGELTMSSITLRNPGAPARGLPELPAALLDPGAFPHHPDRVELRETHISWVFLAGDRAYKVKKPVVVGLVDYGTPERRRACCGEEIRVNRRLAPSVYVGIVALVPHGPTGLAIAPEHDPRAVEYAVEMRRYQGSATLASALMTGRVIGGDVSAIGARLAHFHAGLEPETLTDATNRLVTSVEETLASVTEAAAGQLEPSRIAALARFARAGLAGFGARLRERESAGHVREGHGDLRAEHIVLGDHMQIVDAVDFDPTRRIADVAYDLASLVMDVVRSDERLARALVRGYVAAGGSPGDEQLLAFLVFLRALERIDAELQHAATLEGADHRGRLLRVAELLALAERFAWRARLPRVVCVAGLAASGKSTLATALGDASGLPVLSSEVVRQSHAQLDGAAPRYHGREVSRAVYERLGSTAAGAAREEGGAIVDATFRHAEDVAAFQMASDAAAQAGWITCHAPPDLTLERARWRAATRGATSDADPAVVAAQLARPSGRLPLPRPPLAELETVRAVPILLDELAATLDAQLALRGKPACEARSGPDDASRTADEHRVRHPTLEV